MTKDVCFHPKNDTASIFKTKMNDHYNRNPITILFAHVFDSHAYLHCSLLIPDLATDVHKRACWLQALAIIHTIPSLKHHFEDKLQY